MKTCRKITFALAAAVAAAATALTGPLAAGDGMQAFERGDYKAALQVWRPFAEQGSARAQYNLSIMLEKGLGLEKNPDMALKWLSLAADSGSLLAQRRLADMYDTGTGVAKNLKLAHKWYLASARQGDVNCQRRIGFMYATAQGISQDMPRAYQWFSVAAQSGDEKAKKILSLLVADMTPKNIDEGKKLAFAWIENRRVMD